MPTFERLARFDREFRRMPREMQRAFLAMLPVFVGALKAKPPEFPVALRVHRVQGVSGVWEITFAPDGRATFEYGKQVIDGEPHVIWRRIGTHDVLGEP
jgi:mRNA-degrading endonuclease YafQ of YafQ-DinJ toxin-antitoxin module